VNVGALSNPATSAVDFRAQPPAVATTPVVPTELPASQALNAAANIPPARNDQRKPDRATATAREIIDPQTSAIVYQSIDAQGHVIEQVPTQALLRRRAYEEAQTAQAVIQGKDVAQAVLGAVENVDTTT
jgi:hypothetical protein